MRETFGIGEYRVLVRSQKEVLQNDKVRELFEPFSTETKQAGVTCDLELLCGSDLVRTAHKNALSTLKLGIPCSSEKTWVATLDAEKPDTKCRVVTTAPHVCDAFRGALGLFLKYRLLTSEEWFFHSSGVLINDRVYLFFGKSGSGKSTIALRARQAGLAVLSDDKIYISRSAHNYLAYGTPLGRFSDGPLNGPVVCAIFLKQGDTTSFRPIGPSVATVQAWSDTLYHFLIANTPTRKRIFEEWFDFFSTIPCFEMEFPIDFDDWDRLVEVVENA